MCIVSIDRGLHRSLLWRSHYGGSQLQKDSSVLANKDRTRQDACAIDYSKKLCRKYEANNSSNLAIVLLLLSKNEGKLVSGIAIGACSGSKNSLSPS